MAGVLLYFIFLGGLINSGVSKSGLNKAKVADDDGSSDDGTSSLEESVEEHKQPQTEEIMNAELIAGVNRYFQQNATGNNQNIPLFPFPINRKLPRTPR